MATSTYAINTTRGKEFAVEGEIVALGLKPWVPKILLSKSVKEKPEPVWYDRAYVPKLMFCVIPAIYWPDVVGIKHVIGKPYELSRRDIEGTPAHTKAFKDAFGHPVHVPEVPGLKRFQQAVESEYAERERLRANNEYQCHYRPGQALELLGGAFEGMPAVFRDVVKRAYDDYAKLRLDVTVFGRETTVEVAPDMVRPNS